jgi:hypothetical protein
VKYNPDTVQGKALHPEMFEYLKIFALFIAEEVASPP